MSARSIRRASRRRAERELGRARNVGARSRAAKVAGAAAAATVLLPAAAEAATFTVNTTEDSNDGLCTPLGALGLDCTLREAVYAANTAPNVGGSDIVNFAAAVTGSIELSNAAGGDINIADALTIDGPGASTLAVDANGSGIFDANTTTLSIDDLTLREADGSPNPGGALYSRDTDTTLAGMVFYNNYAVVGGAIAIDDGDLTITGSAFYDNSAHSDGGAVDSLSGDVSIVNSTLSGNTAFNGNGGAVINRDTGSTLTLDNATLGGNFAQYGGGALYSTAATTITGSHLYGNQAFDGDGGAVHNDSADGLTVADSQVNFNYAYEHGGALYSSDDVSLTGTYVVGNTTGRYGGGGIHVFDSSAAITIDGSHLSLNYAYTSGGGLRSNAASISIANSSMNQNETGNSGGAVSHHSNPSGALEIADSTLRFNDAVFRGGAVSSDGGVSVTGSYLEHNVVSNGPGGAINNYNPTGTLTVGTSTLRGNYASDGGALYTNADVTISGGSLTANTASSSGGAIFAADSGALDIDATTLSGNQAEERGGALYTGAATSITGSTLETNAAEDDSGGAVHLYDGALNMSQTTVSGNDAGGYGGGINVVATEGVAATEVTLSDTEISGNTADRDGGGLALRALDASAAIAGTTIADNESGNYGGGLFVAYTPADVEVTVGSTTLSGNYAYYGGGAYVYDNEGPVTFENSTVSGNEAYDEGGGIWLDPYGGQVTLRNSTIVENAASTGAGTNKQGGGVYLDDDNGGPDVPVVVRSTIVADNVADLDADLAQDGPNGAEGFVLGFSLLEPTPAAITFTEIPAGSNIFVADPGLGPLADNGGPTKTHEPAISSPVIDQGISNSLTEDQRGLPRIVDSPGIPNAAGGDGADIGSVEQQTEVPAGPPPPPAAVETGSCQGQEVPELNGTAGNDSLTGTPGTDLMFGLQGNDSLTGGGGSDCLNGNEGNDTQRGGGGKDRVFGSSGKDKLKGGGGRDTLKAGPGNDRLSGGAGRDRINCGAGKKDKVTADSKDKVSKNCEKVVEAG